MNNVDGLPDGDIITSTATSNGYVLDDGTSTITNASLSDSWNNYSITYRPTYSMEEKMKIKLTQAEIKAVRKAAKKNGHVADALVKILEEVEFEVDPFGDIY